MGDATATTHYSGYTEDEMKPLVAGDTLLPNYEPRELATVMNNLAAVGHSYTIKWGYAQIPGERHGVKAWAFFFLAPRPDMSLSGFGGDGYVVAYGPSYPKAEPICGYFAICKHEKEMGAGANERRGWSPGRCRLCGIDMTIDSGD